MVYILHAVGENEREGVKYKDEDRVERGWWVSVRKVKPTWQVNSGRRWTQFSVKRIEPNQTLFVTDAILLSMYFISSPRPHSRSSLLCPTKFHVLSVVVSVSASLSVLYIISICL